MRWKSANSLSSTASHGSCGSGNGRRPVTTTWHPWAVASDTASSNPIPRAPPESRTTSPDQRAQSGWGYRFVAACEGRSHAVAPAHLVVVEDAQLQEHQPGQCLRIVLGHVENLDPTGGQLVGQALCEPGPDPAERLGNSIPVVAHSAPQSGDRQIAAPACITFGSPVVVDRLDGCDGLREGRPPGPERLGRRGVVEVEVEQDVYRGRPRSSSVTVSACASIVVDGSRRRPKPGSQMVRAPATSSAAATAARMLRAAAEDRDASARERRRRRSGRRTVIGCHTYRWTASGTSCRLLIRSSRQRLRDVAAICSASRDATGLDVDVAQDRGGRVMDLREHRAVGRSGDAAVGHRRASRSSRRGQE